MNYKITSRSIPDPRTRTPSPKPDEVEKWKTMQDATAAAKIKQQEPIRAA